MNIKILGTGCKKCASLAEHAKEAVANTGVDASLEKIEDFKEIMKYGVMQTPAIVIDGQVKACGKVLSVKEIERLLTI